MHKRRLDHKGAGEVVLIGMGNRVERGPEANFKKNQLPLSLSTEMAVSVKDGCGRPRIDPVYKVVPIDH